MYRRERRGKESARMTRLCAWKRWSVAATPWVTASLFACSAAKTGSVGCPRLDGSGEWALQMVATSADYHVDGHLRFAAERAYTELTATTADGARERIEYPVQTLATGADSISFTFAPIGYRLDGRCVSQHRLQGVFRVPQPPFNDMVGTWTLVKSR